jgi:hypothetical protein
MASFEEKHLKSIRFKLALQIYEILPSRLLNPWVSDYL